jgi:small-conductance mechanosensitive channel
MQFWLMLVFDLTLFVIGALALMSLWGVSWADMRVGIKAVGEGIQIGGLTISAGDIAVAILVFVVMLAITRWFQRVLEDRVFPQTSLDIGVRHSLKTVTGYVGLTLAVFMAIAALGIDLSNLALIAGALSVGIGFGLQSVVNNFVSGLILLAERPVTVGDWVVVGQHQGYVKRINVRATEIQTFQRSSVIIPNSEMVSGALVNWTHKDTYARVDIKVGVAYGSDTEKVRDILLKCAHDHPRANAWPEPFVLFQNFGESSLDFELRFFIGQADEVFRIGSDVRFAIDKGFRENGITIPFPQRDLHIQDIDRLADLMGNDAKTDGSTRRQRNNPKDGPPASQKGQDAPT